MALMYLAYQLSMCSQFFSSIPHLFFLFPPTYPSKCVLKGKPSYNMSSINLRGGFLSQYITVFSMTYLWKS